VLSRIELELCYHGGNDNGQLPVTFEDFVEYFLRGPFMHSGEERLRQFIHHEALRRAGLPWPPPHDDGVRWWAGDEKQQARNRGIYHGLRRLSLHVINDLIGKALDEAADADAVKAARRFTFAHRERIGLLHSAVRLCN
jgi:hypothetical protein